MSYKKMNLVKVIDNHKALYDEEESFWAVDDDTYDNMMNSESGFSFSQDPGLASIKMVDMGTINVQEK